MQKLIIFALLAPTIVSSVSFWPPGYEPEQQLELENQLIEELNEQQFVSKTNIQMPGVTPFQNETYFCTSYSLNNENTNFLIGFEPISNLNSVHHILLFGCEEPGSDDLIWNCGEMSHTGNSFAKAPACKNQPNILFAWAHGASKLDIPKGVGFRVGGNTKNNFLILQVHYMHAIKKPDYSGISVISTIVPQPRTAATLLLVTGGKIKPKSSETLESACVVDEPIEMHPFAFRVHTHRHGTNVGGWLVQENAKTGKDNWTLLGERNPQLPQLFESVKNQSIIIQQGDILAGRCKIKNNENRIIEVGATGEDEMCNFYLMYWVDGDQTLSNNICFSPGPPNYYWGREAGLNHIPK